MFNIFKKKEDKEFCSIGLVWPADYNLISFYRFFELVHECNLEVADMRYLKGNETNMNNFIVNGSSKDIAEFRSKLPRVCKDFEII